MNTHPNFPNTENMTPFEKKNEMNAYWRGCDEYYKAEIKRLVKKRKIDYTKWKCVELRDYLRKELHPESRVGLSKWKKDEMIYMIKKNNESIIESNHYHRQDAMWRILEQKIRDKCEEQGITDKGDLLKIGRNFHHKCCDNNNKEEKWLFLLYPDYYNEIDEEISTYQFKDIMKYPF